MVSPLWSRNRTEKLQDCWRGGGAVTAKPPGGSGDVFSKGWAALGDFPGWGRDPSPPTAGSTYARPTRLLPESGSREPHLIFRGILRRAAQKSIQHRSSPRSPDGVTGAMREGAQTAGYGWSLGQENPISTSEWVSAQPVTPSHHDPVGRVPPLPQTQLCPRLPHPCDGCSLRHVA